ncbi:MAG: 50S ribosomal protein L25/general stress protein Ctc [Chlorobi bacterium]|nr:50S ribosomal protein L25/general stress protein Ctc [Chlorobiota bacterium]
MDTIDIKVSKREETGKKASKRLRKEGLVPCVMYGGEDVLHFSAPELAFKKLIYTPKVFLVNLDVDGKPHKAVLKDLNFHPLTDHIIHLDFLEIFENKPVNISVPVHIIGDSVGIKAGGKLRLKRRTLRIRALPKDLPDYLEVDITPLDIGQSIKIKDLQFDNIEILDPDRAMVVGVVSSRIARTAEEIAEEEAAEAEAAEAAAAAEGETSESAESANTEKKEE